MRWEAGIYPSGLICHPSGRNRCSKRRRRDHRPVASVRQTQEAVMHTEIHVFDKPIERIKDTCSLMGMAGEFERKLPELETYLEGLVADGEIDEDRLTVSGLSFLKGYVGRRTSRTIR